MVIKIKCLEKQSLWQRLNSFENNETFFFSFELWICWIKKLTFSSVFSASAVAALYSASSWSARASAFSVSVWWKVLICLILRFKEGGGVINLYALLKRPEVQTTLDLDIHLVLLLVLAFFIFFITSKMSKLYSKIIPKGIYIRFCI